MYITKEQLIEAIENATVKKKIKVPSEDYYHHDECESDSITYVCPHQLIQEINNIEEDE